MATLTQIRNALWSARIPIAALLIYRVASLLIGYIFTPAPVLLPILEVVYWLLYFGIGWSLGRASNIGLLHVAAVGLIVYFLDIAILYAYFWLSSPSFASLQYAIHKIGFGSWYMPGLVAVAVVGALVGHRSRSRSTNAGA
jgi:hypothetical protein